MFPPEPFPTTESLAERRLFDAIESQLSNDWTVLHSLNLSEHTRKHWAEIDFVLIGPPGIYCLEVKGGRIVRRDGEWHFINRSNQASVKKEGPFEQAKLASYALRQYLLKQLPDVVYTTAVGWGVAFPDISFKERGPEMEPRLIYDERDISGRFGTYIRRLVEYWHEKLEADRSSPIETLSAAQVHRVFEVLRGDFDLRPSLRARIGQASGELLKLTEEQYGVVEGLSTNQRVLIRGGAGTGKTLLAIEESRRLAREGKRVFLCCFNKQLSYHLRGILKDLNSIDVYHLHGFMKKLVWDSGYEHRLPPAGKGDLSAVFYPELTVEILLQTERLGHYDALIIDEGQDLLLTSYTDVFDGLLDGGLANGYWRIFLDHNQDIFQGTSPQALQHMLACKPAEYRLSINCRNTKPIAFGVRLISGAGSIESLRVEGPRIEEIWYRDTRHQQREIVKCIRRILSEGVPPSDLVILSRYGHESNPLFGSLSELGLQLDPYGSYPLNERECVRFATVQSFKGLESDVVILADIDDLTSLEALHSYYVGGSRARAYLALFMHEGQKEAYGSRAAQYGGWLREQFDTQA